MLKTEKYTTLGGDNVLYAGFWKRTLAYIIDSLILWFVFLIFGLIWMVIRTLGDWVPSPAESSLLSDGSSSIVTMKVIGQTLLNWGAIWLYYALMESS
ncbi:RDD family protein [compost metagenome]